MEWRRSDLAARCSLRHQRHITWAGRIKIGGLMSQQTSHTAYGELAVSGRRMMKVVPLPISVSKVSVPPCFLAITVWAM